MKFMKSMILMAIGGMGVIAFQKYKQPLMNKVMQMVDEKM